MTHISNFLYLSIKKQVCFLSETDENITPANTLFLLVTIRKYLELKNIKQEYPSIVFFADWTVHPAKNNIPKHVKQILESFYIAKEKLEAQRELFRMSTLRTELKELSTKIHSPDIFKFDKSWRRFHQCIIELLDESDLTFKYKDETLILRYSADSGYASWETTIKGIRTGAFQFNVVKETKI